MLTDYRLGLYGSDEYIRERGMPSTTSELSNHSLIYYVEDLAERETTLRRVLFVEVVVIAQYWARMASGRLRRPSASAVMQAIENAVVSRRHELLPPA